MKRRKRVSGSTKKTVRLYGQLNIPGFTFYRFFPTFRRPLTLQFCGNIFDLCVSKKDLFNVTLDPLPSNVIAKKIFARFRFESDKANSKRIDKNCEPRGKQIEEYKESLQLLRKNLWLFAAYELKQDLPAIDFFEEIPLWREEEDKIHHLRSEIQNPQVIKAWLYPREMFFDRRDSIAFSRFWPRSDKEKEKIERVIYKKASDACLREDYRMAILEATICLEILINRMLQRKLEESDYKKIDKHFRGTSLIGRLQILLTLFPQKAHFLRERKWLEIVVRGVDIRNNIVHSAQKKVEENTAVKYVNAVGTLLDSLIPRRLNRKKKSGPKHK